MRDDEQWLPLTGLEDTHEVSSWGRIRSNKTGLYTKPWIDAKGYVRFVVRRKNIRAHRAVLTAFVGPCPDGYEGAHLDGVPGNNRLSNLQWKSSSQNKADQLRHGTLVWGERHRDAKLTDADVAEIRRRRKEGETWKSIHTDWSMVTRHGLIQAGVGTTFRHLSEPPAPRLRSR